MLNLVRNASFLFCLFGAVAKAGYGNCAKEIAYANAELTRVAVIEKCDGSPGDWPPLAPQQILIYDIASAPKIKLVDSFAVDLSKMGVPESDMNDEAAVKHYQTVADARLQKALAPLIKQGFQKADFAELQEDKNIDRRVIKKNRYEDQATFLWPDNKDLRMQLEWVITGGKISPIRLSLRNVEKKSKTQISDKLLVEDFSWNDTAYSDPRLFVDSKKRFLFGLFGTAWSGIWVVPASAIH